MAMDKYSRRKASSSKLSDSQLISREITQHSTPRRPRGESSTSVDSNSSMGLDTEVGGNSYGAMLRSYAKRTESQVGGAGREGGGAVARGNGSRGGQREKKGEREVDSEGYAVALSLNYEVSDRSVGR